MAPGAPRLGTSVSSAWSTAFFLVIINRLTLGSGVVSRDLFLLPIRSDTWVWSPLLPELLTSEE